MSMHINQMGLLRCQNQAMYKQQNRDNRMAQNQSVYQQKSDAMAAKRMLRQKQELDVSVDEQGRKTFSGKSIMSSITSSQDYAKTLANARAKDKNTDLKMKKLKYNFKSISSQLMRSKTSSNAKQVASKAKREVLRLKRLKQSEAYDEEELSAAIAHAQSMERVAKKKVRHLEEEEMVKISGGPCMDKLEEDKLEPDNNDLLEEDEANEAGANEYEGEDSLAAYEEEMAFIEEDLAPLIDMESIEVFSESIESEVADVSEEMMSDMMDEMWDSLNDLLEEMGLSELADTMFAPDDEMDPADLKMMKIKHRCKEMKEIAKADSEYLKEVFDKLAKDGSHIVISEAQTPHFDMKIAAPELSVGGNDFSAQTMSGGFDMQV